MSPLPLVDLMDIDIQGAENVVIHPAMEMLNARVKRLHIGTHSPDIHSGLWELFFANEWICEFDYAPATTHQTPWEALRPRTASSISAIPAFEILISVYPKVG